MRHEMRQGLGVVSESILSETVRIGFELSLKNERHISTNI